MLIAGNESAMCYNLTAEVGQYVVVSMCCFLKIWLLSPDHAQVTGSQRGCMHTEGKDHTKNVDGTKNMHEALRDLQLIIDFYFKLYIETQSRHLFQKKVS